MKVSDLPKIEQIFHAASELEGIERDEYLQNASGGDPVLAGNVRSLIDALDSDPDFLEDPALGLGFEILESSRESDLVDQIFNSYKIEKKLGQGGMGAVYLAHDSALDRNVALKFLSPDLVDNDQAKRQLIREAQAVAGLDHPNICTVYDIEQIGQHQFIVMQYIDGTNLSSMIREDLFDRAEIINLIHQIASAIAAAHDWGMIHRDIKPGNIMVTKDNRVKVLDFGLAKIVHGKNRLTRAETSQMSRKGLIIGTVAYMSPEQLRAEKLDFRSDIFSLGTVLFELCTKKNPFARASEAETISAILSNEFESKVLTYANVPSGLKKVILRCLENDKDKRYQSVNDLLIELQSCDRTIESNSRHPLRRLGKIPFLAMVIVILITGLFTITYFPAKRHYAIAVLPFSNETADPSLDYLSDGMADGIINRLAMASTPEQLSIKPYTEVSGYHDTDPAKTGRRVGADLVLSGTISRSGDQVYFNAVLLNTAADAEIWGDTNPFQADDISTVQRKLAEHFLDSMQISPRTSAPNKEIVGEAYQSYILGKYYWNKRDRDNIQKAIAAFRRAIDIDPTYANAYAGLANSYVVQSLVAYGSMPTKEVMSRAKAAAKQAVELDPESSEARTSLGVVLMKHDWDWAGAETEFKRALVINSENAEAHYWYGSLLAVLGRTDESIDQAAQAKELDPFSPLVNVNLARSYYYARQFDKALNVLRENPDNEVPDVKIKYMTGLVNVQKGMYREALPLFQEIYSSNKLLGGAALGYTYAKLGMRNRAKAVIAELKEIDQEKPVPTQELAIIYIGLGDRKTAFKFLREAFAERHSALIALRVEPLFDDIRVEKEYQDLLLGMNLDK